MFVMLALLMLPVNAEFEAIHARWNSLMDTIPLHHIICRQRNEWPLIGESFTRDVEFWFASPNRFRASYSAPDSHLVIADGNTIWTIVPDNMQVLAREQDSSLTWRNTLLGELLTPQMTACRAETLITDDSSRELRLVCRDLPQESPWVCIMLHISGDSTWPTRVVLEDISENITEYIILSWDELQKKEINDSLFLARPPAGYEVIWVDR